MVLFKKTYLKKVIIQRILIFILLQQFFCFSQKETLHWPVGNFKHLDFSQGTPILNNIPQFYNFEASASISDENGNWLYYSNGHHVFDVNHNIITNGDSITQGYGDNTASIFSSTQGCVFEKIPKKNNLLLLFTLDSFESGHNLKYNIIDKSLNKVIVKKKPLIMDKVLIEKMILANHCNHIDKWLIVIEGKGDLLYKNESSGYKDVVFHSILITENGVQQKPISTTINLNENNFIQFFGQMKINNKGDQLVMGDLQGISLFQFDNATGVVTFNKHIDFQSSFTYKYGIEFSPNDKVVYADENQIDLTNNNFYNYLGKSQSSQLQIGADDKIYRFTLPDSNSVGGGFMSNGPWVLSIERINQPNNLNVNCNYEPNFFQFVDSGFYAHALPNIPQHFFNRNKAEFAYNSTCSGNSVEMFLNNTSIPFDSIIWEVNGATFMNEDTISYSFPSEGSYSVTCHVVKDSLSFTSNQCVIICGNSDVILPKKIDLCLLDSVILNTMNTCSINYLWNTGDTTSAIVIKDEGVYWIKTTNVCGVSYDTVIVTKEGCIPIIDIPNVFTPNNDQQNELFTVNMKGVKSFNFYIMNRWGDIVKDSTIVFSPQNVLNLNSVNLWDGFVKQKEATEGVYFYGIKYISENDIEFEKTGFFHLIR